MTKKKLIFGSENPRRQKKKLQEGKGKKQRSEKPRQRMR